MNVERDNEEIRQLLNKALDKQFNKGIEKYGHGVEVDDPQLDWIEEAVEEVMDAQVYLAAKLIQLRRRTLKKKTN